MIQFPQWLGKNSSRSKRTRLLAELGLHLSSYVSGGREAVRLEYFDLLRARIMAPLVAPNASEHSAEAAEAAIVLLDAYGLSSTDLMETMIEISFAADDSGAFVDFVSAAGTHLLTVAGHITNPPPPPFCFLTRQAMKIDSRVKAAFTREYK